MLHKILKSKLISFLFFASILFVLGALGWAYSALRSIPGPIVVRFNNASGITELGGFLNLASVAATGIVIVVINFFLALELRERDRFLGTIIAASTLLMSALIFIGFAAIIAVN